MKKLIFLTVFCFLALGYASAQKLVIGEKAPEIKVKEWIADKPADENNARLVEFFHSGNKQCVTRLKELDRIAKKFKKLNVIVVSKESAEKVSGILAPGSQSYYPALDDAGKTFENFGVQFVPFGVLIDKKGKVVWFGNPSSLSDDEIGEVAK